MPKKVTRTEFIKRAHKKHQGKFDYRKSIYINYDTKLIIVCKLHGDFEQTPHDHLSGYGCPTCGKSKKLTTESFIDKAHIKHGNRYNYSKVNYTNSKTKVTITCPIHGDFEQIPASHLYGRGCPSCSRVSTFEQFVEKANKEHCNKYTYLPPATYSFTSFLIIICPIHGEFMQKATYHLSGRGCSKCSKSGFDVSKPGTLYYIKLKDHRYYKIGITNYSIKDRFSHTDLEKIEIVRTWHYESGQECYETEQKILKDFSSMRYIGPKLLQSGNTEIFVSDILCLDTPLIFTK